MSDQTFRPGTVIEPLCRLPESRLADLHEASLAILDNPGVVCFSREAAEIYSQAGCTVSKSEREDAWTVRIPAGIAQEAIESAPSTVTLGAREEKDSLLLKSRVPRIYFGTGSETNVFLETDLEEYQAVNNPDKRRTYPRFRPERGSIHRLCESAKICDALTNVDFFIRNVNIQDEAISEENKDVNMFFAGLMYMTKHVQAGLNNIAKLDDVLRMARIIAGDEETLRRRPPLSFIACLVKSPLQMVADTTKKVIEIARQGMPLVISSSPQGGSTAPVHEEGMVALINAEILAGITLTQLVNPGTPVLYGAVPVRARLDTLHDLYGVPEFVHYNQDCVQMARFYRVPCYSTAGVGDAKIPGMQASTEKLLTHLGVAYSGAQYIHYAFGLLDRTNIFCPLQAVLDDAALSLVRDTVRPPLFDETDIKKAVAEVQTVMNSSTRLFARHIRKHLRRGVVSNPYSLSSDTEYDTVIEQAYERLTEIRNQPGSPLPDSVIEKIRAETPGLLPQEYFTIEK